MVCIEHNFFLISEEKQGSQYLRETFEVVNTKLKQYIAQNFSNPNEANFLYRCGSTGITAIFWRNHVIVANVGDTRGVMYIGGSTRTAAR